MTFDRQMYQDALDSQTACNLSGLVNTLARHTKTIWDESHKLGRASTDYVNTHPVVALFLHQMAYLNGANADLLGEDWSTAHRLCELRATDPIGVAEELVAQVMALLRRESDCACSPAIFEPCPHCAECKDKALEFLGIPSHGIEG